MSNRRSAKRLGRSALTGRFVLVPTTKRATSTSSEIKSAVWSAIKSRSQDAEKATKPGKVSETANDATVKSRAYRSSPRTTMYELAKSAGRQDPATSKDNSPVRGSDSTKVKGRPASPKDSVKR